MKENETKVCVACRDNISRLARTEPSGILAIVNRLSKELEILKVKIEDELIR